MPSQNEEPCGGGHQGNADELIGEGVPEPLVEGITTLVVLLGVLHTVMLPSLPVMYLSPGLFSYR